MAARAQDQSVPPGAQLGQQVLLAGERHGRGRGQDRDFDLRFRDLGFGDRFEAGQMMVFRPGDSISLKAGAQGARIMALGGATLNEKRYTWWTFVSSSKDKIEEAKEAWKSGDWESGPFSLPPGDTDEFIPITPELDRTRPKG